MTEKTVKQFREELASSEPVPGGGGAAALAASLALALGSMTCALAGERKKGMDDASRKKAEELHRKCSEISQSLLDLADKDSEVFGPLRAAMKMPHSTPEEKAARDAELEKRYEDAASVPLTLMSQAERGLRILEQASKFGSRFLLSDIGTAAVLVRAASESAQMIIRTNTMCMKNRDRAECIDFEAEELMSVIKTESDVLYRQVKEDLGL
ncbi:MAG: cyclodeaminase/cyclohydrolase family protein [Lachnospiraceae bacterium]